MHFLVLELVEGQDLAERLALGRLSVEETLPLAIQIAEALEAAHDRGIVHRDLKPANIVMPSTRPDEMSRPFYMLDFTGRSVSARTAQRILAEAARGLLRVS